MEKAPLLSITSLQVTHITPAYIPLAYIPRDPIQTGGGLGNVGAQEEQEVGLVNPWHCP